MGRTSIHRSTSAKILPRAALFSRRGPFARYTGPIAEAFITLAGYSPISQPILPHVRARRQGQRVKAARSLLRHLSEINMDQAERGDSLNVPPSSSPHTFNPEVMAKRRQAEALKKHSSFTSPTARVPMSELANRRRAEALKAHNSFSSPLVPPPPQRADETQAQYQTRSKLQKEASIRSSNIDDLAEAELQRLAIIRENALRAAEDARIAQESIRRERAQQDAEGIARAMAAKNARRLAEAVRLAEIERAKLVQEEMERQAKEAKEAAVRERLAQEHAELKRKAAAARALEERLRQERETRERAEQEELRRRREAERMQEEAHRAYMEREQQRASQANAQFDHVKEEQMLRQAFLKYDNDWAMLKNNHHAKGSLPGSEFPWCLLNGTIASLEDITADRVRAFIFHPIRMEGKTKKHALKQAALQYHPDKLAGVIQAVDPQWQALVLEVGELVMKRLNEIKRHLK